MDRPNNIPLPNLPILEKLIYSGFILGGLSIFALTWYQVVAIVYWQQPVAAQDLFFGVGLGYLAWTDTSSFYRLLAFHTVGVALLLGVSVFLFRKTSLRRRVKTAITALAVVLASVDVAGWMYAPHCSSSNMYVGYSGVLSALPMLFLALSPLSQMWLYRRWKSGDGKPKRVIVIGGGFAGLYAAMGLNKSLGYNRDLELTVLDRKNYFLFPPLLPSAAAGTIETRQVSYPFRRIFETTNVRFRRVEVTGVDPLARTVSGIVDVSEDSIGRAVGKKVELPYDYLVISPGSLTQTFETKGAAEHAFFMRELNDAVILRNHVIDCFERAAAIDDEELQQQLLRFVIVGAGPTGVETATELADLIHHVLLKRYPEIPAKLPEVRILQSGEQILPGWSNRVIGMTERQLNKLSIRLMLKVRVVSIDAESVTIASGETLLSRTVIWCAGVKPSGLLACCGLPLERSGRIAVDDTLRVPIAPNIFVLGDAAHCLDRSGERALPPLGQVAFQQGSHTAKNLVRALEGRKLKPFRYFNFGSLVSVGEHFAAVDLLGVKLSGFIGWFVWRSLYLVKLVGTSNRIRVMIDWTLDLLIERSISQIRESRTVQEPLHSPAAGFAAAIPQPRLTSSLVNRQ